MDAAQDFRLADANCHTGEPRVKLVKHVALLSTSLGDDRALSSTVNEGLHWVSIHLGVDVEHGDVAKELGVVLHRGLVVGLDHLLPDFFFNHLLGLDVVWVCVSQLDLALLLCLLSLHNFLESVVDDFLDLGDVVG